MANRTNRVLRLVAAAPLIALFGCSTSEGGAMVACEKFVNQRVGAELTHRSPMEGATVDGDNPYVVRSAFTEPATGHTTEYQCEVERIPDGWRLIDLSTDR